MAIGQMQIRNRDWMNIYLQKSPTLWLNAAGHFVCVDAHENGLKGTRCCRMQHL